MAIKNVSFTTPSFGRSSGGGSFTDTIRQQKLDEENKRRYEIAQARLAQQDAIAAADRTAQNARLATADSRAQTVFDQGQADRAQAQKAMELLGSTTPVSPYKETVTPTTVVRTPEEIAAMKTAYQGEGGNDLLGQDPRALEIEKRLAELTPQIANAPIQSGKEQITEAVDSIDPTSVAMSTIPGSGAFNTAMNILGDAATGAKDWYNGETSTDIPTPESTPSEYDIKKDAYDAGQKEFDKLAMEYSQLDKNLRDEKTSELLADVGTSYTKNIKETMPRTAQGFRKAQIDAIDKTLKEQKVPEKDRAGIRARMLKELDPRAIEQGKIAAQYRKDVAAKRQAEIAAAAEVQKNATTQKEKSNSAYYKQQEADLKRLDNERLTMAKLYSDDRDNKIYLAEDAKIKAQQQRIRDTLKKQ